MLAFLANSLRGNYTHEHSTDINRGLILLHRLPVYNKKARDSKTRTVILISQLLASVGYLIEANIPYLANNILFYYIIIVFYFLFCMGVKLGLSH
jgi:hypothetical protein